MVMSSLITRTEGITQEKSASKTINQQEMVIIVQLQEHQEQQDLIHCEEMEFTSRIIILMEIITHLHPVTLVLNSTLSTPQS